MGGKRTLNGYYEEMTAPCTSPRTTGSGWKQVASKCGIGILMLVAAATSACSSSGSDGSPDNNAGSSGGPTSNAVTPSPPPSSQAPTAAAIPEGYTIVSARNFGVTCDGVMDDTQALQSALNGLKSFQALQLPAGTCVYSNILSLGPDKTNVMVVGAGKDATILKATDPLRSSFVVANGSANVIVSAFQVYSPSSTTRTVDANGRGIYVDRASNVIVDNVKVVKVSGAGVLFSHVTGGMIQNSEVDDNLADSFHVTTGSSNITMQFIVARRGGDDAFGSIG
jgi:polygalacturonase